MTLSKSRDAVIELLRCYANAVDSRDWIGVRNCYFADAVDDQTVAQRDRHVINIVDKGADSVACDFTSEPGGKQLDHRGTMLVLDHAPFHHKDGHAPAEEESFGIVDPAAFEKQGPDAAAEGNHQQQEGSGDAGADREAFGEVDVRVVLFLPAFALRVLVLRRVRQRFGDLESP